MRRRCASFIWLVIENTLVDLFSDRVAEKRSAFEEKDVFFFVAIKVGSACFGADPPASIIYL